jgi:C1A family cysteine protease
MKKLCLVLALVLSVCVVAQDPLQEIEMIKQIQSLTRSSDWEPGITSMSYLTYDQRANLCGLYPDPNFPKMPERGEDYAARGSADLRYKMGSVKNQASCGSCWAFAMIGCVEAVHNGKVDLSEQELVSCCKSSSGCNGGYIGSTASWVKTQGGALLEKDYPYTSGSGNNGSCKNLSGTRYNINGYSNVTSDSAIKAALDSGYTVNTGMKVYQDFYNYKSGVYKYTTGSYLGGHAVVICGYNDSGKYWIVKNSWGTGWGEKGYFRIAYGDCSIPWMAISVR